MSSTEEELFKVYSGKKFEEALEGFQPKNNFERKLTLGVLFRDGKIARDVSSKGEVVQSNHSR